MNKFNFIRNITHFYRVARENARHYQNYKLLYKVALYRDFCVNFAYSNNMYTLTLYHHKRHIKEYTALTVNSALLSAVYNDFNKNIINNRRITL